MPHLTEGAPTGLMYKIAKLVYGLAARGSKLPDCNCWANDDQDHTTDCPRGQA